MSFLPRPCRDFLSCLVVIAGAMVGVLLWLGLSLESPNGRFIFSANLISSRPSQPVTDVDQTEWQPMPSGDFSKAVDDGWSTGFPDQNRETEGAIISSDAAVLANALFELDLDEGFSDSLTIVDQAAMIPSRDLPVEDTALPDAVRTRDLPQVETAFELKIEPETPGVATDPPQPLVTAVLPRIHNSSFAQVDSEVPEWWLARVADVQRNQATFRQVGLSDLIDQAIAQSPRIRMLQRLPAMADTAAERERSVFDPIVRLDTKFRGDQDPVANRLQTGGPPVLEDNNWSATAGIQRRLASGTTADLFQRLGFKNSNSLFFSPQDQGTASVGLDIVHPLLRNSGREFNRSQIVLAELQGQISFYDYQVELQREMVEIGNLYWQLLHARQVVLQAQRSRDRATQILGILADRADYDASASQIATAKSEVSQREMDVLETQRNLREIEISLRDKINDTDFASEQDVELVPSEFFDEIFSHQVLALHEALRRGLANRWELSREEGKTQAADRQLYVSRCGLAPKLDLVLGVYSNGLAGGSGIEQAWTNQFGSANPGYYGGLEYEVPYGRREAKAAILRDRLQKQQALDALTVARNEVIAQIKTAHLRVETASQTRATALQSVLDMRAVLNHMQQRWETAALVDGAATAGVAPSIALEQLLTGQRRLQEAELRLVTADLQLALTHQSLLLAMGEVLQTHVASETLVEPPSEQSLESTTETPETALSPANAHFSQRPAVPASSPRPGDGTQ
jgi:hypothetical protein